MMLDTAKGLGKLALEQGGKVGGTYIKVITDLVQRKLRIRIVFVYITLGTGHKHCTGTVILSCISRFIYLQSE